MEKTITNSIIRLINNHPKGDAWKRHSSGSSNNTGYPDITGSLFGLRVEIEVKQPGKEPTKIQYQRLQKFRKLGCIAFWTDSVEDAEKKLNRWAHVLHYKDTRHPGYSDIKSSKATIIRDVAA